METGDKDSEESKAKETIMSRVDKLLHHLFNCADCLSSADQ